MRVGIDFDNTIASYDGPMHRWALERKLAGWSAIQRELFGS
jgi:hypothetical protein